MAEAPQELAARHLREHRRRQNAQRLALGEAWRGPICERIDSDRGHYWQFPAPGLAARAGRGPANRAALSRPATHWQRPHGGDWGHAAGDDGPDGPQQPTRRVDLHAEERCRQREIADSLNKLARRAEPPAAQNGTRRKSSGTQRGAKESGCLVITRTGLRDAWPELAGWVVGLRGLEPRTSSLSGKAHGLLICPG